MFLNRVEAGKELAQKLIIYKDKKDVLVLAIPRGGVPVAYQVAKFLNLSLNLLVVRKLPMPEDPEAGMGAISETGEIVWQPQAKFYSPQITQKIVSEQIKETRRRVKIFRGDKKLVDVKNKIVILIDDGLAMGSTMKVAVKTVKKLKAKKVIVAVPVGGREAVNEIKREVSKLICLEIPYPFYAVAQAYKQWHDVSDDEVLNIIRDKTG